MRVKYRLFETQTYRRDLERLGAAASRRIRAALKDRVYPTLRVTPRSVPSAARLRDWDPPTWRIRIGNWRIFYEIDDEKAIVFLTAEKTPTGSGASPPKCWAASS